jgi:hypothetical protein
MFWLGVLGKKNPRAIGFYKKKWFHRIWTSIFFKLGDDEQTDIMMRLEI